MSNKSYTCTSGRCHCCSKYDDMAPVAVDISFLKKHSNHADEKRQSDYIAFFSDFKPAGATSDADPPKLRPSYPTYRQGDITSQGDLFIEVSQHPKD